MGKKHKSKKKTKKVTTTSHKLVTIEFDYAGTRYRGTAYPVENI